MKKKWHQAIQPSKIEEYSQNSLPNPSAEEKTTWNSVPWKNIEANCRNSVPNHSAEEKPAQNKTRQPKISKIMSEKRAFEVRTNHFACFIKLDSDPQFKFRTKWSYTGYPLKNNKK